MTGVTFATIASDWDDDVATLLGAPKEDLAITLAAEHVRAGVSAPGLQSKSRSEFVPVHTGRIMSSVRRNVVPWFGDSGEDCDDDWKLLRSNMEAIGDLVDVGDGYWLPGPTRLIEVGGSNKCLLISGAPFNLLGSPSTKALTSYAGGRWISEDVARTLKREIESVDDWLPTVGDLRAWVVEALRRLARVLTLDHDVEVQRVEIYAPDLLRAQKKSGFWIDAEQFDEQSSRLRLFRPKVSKGWEFSRQYYVGIFTRREGVITLTKSVKVTRDDAARLRFGLDLLSGSSRRLEAKANSRFFEFDLKFSLPQPEARILALAWSPTPDKAHLRFEKSALPFVKAIFARLHVDLFERA